MGYFKCFNAGHYYEAHDVLEELWLKGGKASENYSFYKGLIQIAGGFVHIKLYQQYPGHRIHSNRLDPGARLLRLGVLNTSLYPDPYHDLSLYKLHEICQTYLKLLEESLYTQNPWSPEQLPQLQLNKP